MLYAPQRRHRGMLHEESLDNVFARHTRLGEATRRAVKAWGLENLNKNEKQSSPTITAILLPDGHDADKYRAMALDTFNIAYGASFGAYAGQGILPHRPPRRHRKRRHPHWRAGDHRNGAAACRRAASRRAACRQRWITSRRPTQAPAPASRRSKARRPHTHVFQ